MVWVCKLSRRRRHHATASIVKDYWQKILVSFYRNREEEYLKYFETEESLVNCNDIQGLINSYESDIYKSEEWRLFIDSSKRSLKVMLLHNRNEYATIPIAYSTTLEEDYDTMKLLIEKIKYSDHNWQVCGDLKVLTILLGQQSGFTKYPCFLCLFNSRDRENH